MSETKLLRAAVGVVGVAAMVWGLTGGPVRAEPETAPSPVDTVLATVGQELNASTKSSAVAAGSSRLAQTAVMHPPGADDTRTDAGGAQSAQATNDPDGDGASDEPSDADVNGDGVSDDQDPTIATFETVDGFVSVGIFEPTTEQLRNVRHDAATRSAGNVSLPYGLLGYDVINVTDPVGIILLWEKNASGAKTLYKGTPASVTSYPTEAFVEDDLVVGWGYVLVDGGTGDADGVEDGTIKDPIGPGVTSDTTTTTTTTTTTPGVTTTTAPGATTTTAAGGGTTTTTSATSPTTTGSTTTTTTPGTASDPDGDGVSNEIPNTDVDDDGIRDDRDNTVAFFETTDGLVLVGIADSPGQLRNVRHEPVHSVGNIATPSGLLSFDVVNATGPVKIVAAWSLDGVPASGLYKGTATALSPYPVIEIDSNADAIGVMYALNDGGAGDADGVANGVIVDPVAPGYVLGSTSPTTSSGQDSGGLDETLARTGMSPLFPGAGITLVVVGALLVAVAARPKGLHFG